MTVQLFPRTPEPEEVRFWTPFARNSGFRFTRWSEAQTVTPNCSYLHVPQGETDAVRIELDHGRLAARFHGLQRLPAPPLRIQLIETHVRHRRQGFARVAVEQLREMYPGTVLIAFSVDADHFWDGLNWDRYINIDDDPHSPRMSPLYVDPSPELG